MTIKARPKMIVWTESHEGKEHWNKWVFKCFLMSMLLVWLYIYTVSQKNKTLNSCPKLSQMLTDFQYSFADRLNGKFATKSYLNIRPHLKYVATLLVKYECQKTGSNLKYVFW